MDEQLKHLKESMDRTLLKNGSFRPDEKQNILRAIQNEKRKRERRRRRLATGLSVALSFCLLIGLSWVVYTHLHDKPNSFADKSLSSASQKDSQEASNGQQYSNNNGNDNAVHPSINADINTYKATDKQIEKLDKPYFTYVVFKNYYYKETGDMVTEDKLGQEIGRIRRTGDHNVKKSGDSNDLQPGPIYAIHGEDPAIYIAAKGSIIRNGKNEVGYLIFKKFAPVEQQ
jgi:hypothetical protein